MITNRRFRSAVIVGLWLMLAAPLVSETAVAGNKGASDWTGNPEQWVDQRFEFSAGKASTGELKRVAWIDGRLQLTDEAAARFPATGRWTSEEIETERSFVEWLPSWSVDASADTGLALEVRVRDAGDGSWSPWLRIGEWGRVEGWRDGSVAFADGRVEIDVLRLTRPADAFQTRVVLQKHSADEAASPSLRRLVVVTSRIDPEQAETEAAELEALGLDASRWARDLPVPFYTQQDHPAALRPRTCSPTSTAMVGAYRGVELPMTETALEIYDDEYGIFGNWGRAVAWASQNGLEAELVRLRDWRQVEQLIAAGQPVIASIKFDKGAFPSNLLDSTNGHLIVVRGLTAEGDAIVNDPASAKHGDGVVYKKEELAAAWFGNGGVGYLLGKPSEKAGH